eukprot:scaffold50476_cov63-Phaeocystis_antarctica.AAC.4
MIVQPGLLCALVGFRGLVDCLDGLCDQLDGAQRARVDGDGGDDAVLGDLVVVVSAAAAAAPPSLGLREVAVVEVPGYERVAVRLDLGLASLAHTGLVVAAVRGHLLSLGVAHITEPAVVGRDRPREHLLLGGRIAPEARPARGELRVGEADVVGVAGARGDHRVFVDLSRVARSDARGAWSPAWGAAAFSAAVIPSFARACWRLLAVTSPTVTPSLSEYPTMTGPVGVMVMSLKRLLPEPPKRSTHSAAPSAASYLTPKIWSSSAPGARVTFSANLTGSSSLDAAHTWVPSVAMRACDAVSLPHVHVPSTLLSLAR